MAVQVADAFGGLSFWGYGAAPSFLQTALVHAVVDDTVSSAELRAACDKTRPRLFGGQGFVALCGRYRAGAIR